MGQDECGVQAGSEGLWRAVLLLAMVVALFVLAVVLGAGQRLGNLRGWIRQAGAAGPAVFVTVRAGAVVAMVPGSVLSMAGGALFGPVVGLICVSAGTTAGACASFLIARYWARDAVARWAKRKESFARLDRLTRDYGAIIVALARLVPIVPFNIQNYAFGLTAVGFGTYLFWSWLAMLPGALLAVVGGEVIVRTLTTGRVPWTLLGVLGVTAVAIALLGAYSLWKLRGDRAEQGQAEDDG